MASISNVNKGDWELPFLPRKQCDVSNPYCVMRHVCTRDTVVWCDFDSLCHRYSAALQGVIAQPASTLPAGMWGGMPVAMQQVMLCMTEHRDAQPFESQSGAHTAGNVDGEQQAAPLARRKRLLASKRK